jgi:DUF4097 and DUF4098 domain-containing protein YvlB
MSSYPPPFGFNPKQQARFVRQQMRAQARAQKEAFRAQRELYRYQARGLRRNSILGPIIILSVGVVVLLVRMGNIPFSEFWGWYSRWWPLLLVGAGVVLVGEWAFDQIPRGDGTPYVRRGLGGGAVFLLLILAATGASIQGLHNGHIALSKDFNLDPDTWDEFFGEKHEMSQTIDAAFPAGSSISIDNPHGDVTITGKSADGQVHITVNKQVYTQSDSDATSKADRLNPRVEMMGSTLSVKVPALDGASADISIAVPDFGAATVTANHGDVAVSNLRAPVTVTANHGDINLNEIAGQVNAHINNHDASFSAHHITGDLSLHGHADDLSITDVSGQTALEGEFYGDTHLERLRGPFSFHSNRTQFTFARLDGEVNISPDSDLSATEIVGPTILRTRSRNITLDRVVGDVEVTDSEGSVDLIAAPPLGNVTITDKNGEVNVTAPEHAGFTLDAETRGGEIDSDLSLKPDSNDNRAMLTGTVGAGGPKIMIRTTHLNIGVHTKPEPPLAPLPPLPPPAAPAKPGM